MRTRSTRSASGLPAAAARRAAAAAAARRVGRASAVRRRPGSRCVLGHRAPTPSAHGRSRPAWRRSGSRSRAVSASTVAGGGLRKFQFGSSMPICAANARIAVGESNGWLKPMLTTLNVSVTEDLGQLLHRLGQRPGGRRADLEAAGVDEAHQQAACRDSRPAGPAGPGRRAAVVGHGAADGRLAVAQRGCGSSAGSPGRMSCAARAALPAGPAAAPASTAQ